MTCNFESSKNSPISLIIIKHTLSFYFFKLKFESIQFLLSLSLNNTD